MAACGVRANSTDLVSIVSGTLCILFPSSCAGSRSCKALSETGPYLEGLPRGPGLAGKGLMGHTLGLLPESAADSTDLVSIVSGTLCILFPSSCAGDRPCKASSETGPYLEGLPRGPRLAGKGLVGHVLGAGSCSLPRPQGGPHGDAVLGCGWGGHCVGAPRAGIAAQPLVSRSKDRKEVLRTLVLGLWLPCWLSECLGLG